MSNIKNFDINLLSIHKTSLKSIDAVTYHIKYITMKSFGHVNIDCENSLYPVFNNVDGYIIGKKIMKINTWFLLLWTRIKKYLKSIQNLGMKLKIKLKKSVV